MSSIKFISKASTKPVINKNSRTNKKKQFYKWHLERFTQSNKNSGLEIDVFPSEPMKGGIQLLKDEIIKSLSISSIFDFEYAPIEQDFLSIQNVRNSEDYLSLIFLNGEWCVEQYVSWIRQVTDEYSTISDGVCVIDENTSKA